MGRFYNGDIEGKFWFGVQSSNDADFFGVIGEEPYELGYSYEKENLPDVEKGIKECLEVLGEFKEKIDQFFKENDSYNEKMLCEYLKIETEEEVKTLLEYYARLELGIKIRDCINAQGDCNFTAELQ